jgi:hypothetical protein
MMMLSVSLKRNKYMKELIVFPEVKTAGTQSSPHPEPKLPLTTTNSTTDSSQTESHFFLPRRHRETNIQHGTYKSNFDLFIKLVKESSKNDVTQLFIQPIPISNINSILLSQNFRPTPSCDVING